MKAADFIAFDTETAKAQLNSLCQIGFVVVSNRKIIQKVSFIVRSSGNDYAAWNSISREEAAKEVKSHGADIDTGVTRRTNIVIVGSGAGPSKLKKIEQYNSDGSGIRIIGEDEFLVMIK